MYVDLFFNFLNFTSKNKGAEPCRRYGRLGTTSLLSPGLLLSGNLRRHLTPTIGSLCSAFASVRNLLLTVKLVYAITLSPRFPFAVNQPWDPSVTFWEGSAPLKLPATHCPCEVFPTRVRDYQIKGCYFTGGSTVPKSPLQSLTPILRINPIAPIRSYSKAPGVFSSNCRYPASLPGLYFHRAGPRDSFPLVTPFVHVGTYPTRKYALHFLLPSTTFNKSGAGTFHCRTLSSPPSQTNLHAAVSSIWSLVG